MHSELYLYEYFFTWARYARVMGQEGKILNGRTFTEENLGVT